MGLVWYPSFPVGEVADEVVDGSDGVEEREVDAHEHQQARHRARSVGHLALPPSSGSGLGTVARRSEKGGGPMSPGWARAGSYRYLTARRGGRPR